MANTNHNNRIVLLALVGIFPFLVNGYINSIVHENLILYWGFELVSWIIVPLAIVFFLTRIPGFRFSELGFHSTFMGRKSTPILLTACVAFSPVCYLVYSSVFDFCSSIFPSTSLFVYETIIPEEGFWYYAVVGYFAISAGIVEEFFFRGLLHKAVSGFKNPTVLYLLVSPILFGLIHWENGVSNTVATYIVGLFLCVVFLVFRNIWPLIAGHVWTDLVWFS